VWTPEGLLRKHSQIGPASTRDSAIVSQRIAFEHRRRPFEIRIADDGALELYLDRCLRKRNEPVGVEPQYVWTNVELEWEEHHYVEARWWASARRLEVTVNGAPLLARVLPASNA
jgi:hypothetical protein